jgi:glycerate kinase
VLGLGGSATVDAGTGLLEALGMRFLDKDGHELPGCGDMLGLVDNLDLSALHPRLFDVKLTLACDVRNPLLGKQGAVHVFGPQKGIRPEDLPRFENGMSSFADVVRKACGRDERETPGSGAAGGIAFTLRSLFGAEVVSGFEWIAALGKLEEKVARSHLVVTGEGSFDSQSLSGKVADGIGRIAAHAGVPVIVLTGRDREHRITLPERGLSLIFPIVDETMELSEAMAQAETLIERAAFRLFCALWLGGTLFAGIKRNNSCP